MLQAVQHNAGTVQARINTYVPVMYDVAAMVEPNLH